MIDYEREELISFNSAPKHYPGQKPHIATCHRHRLRGVRGVCLETILVGGKRYTSREAIARFIRAINRQATRGSEQVEALEEATQKEVERRLDEAGIEL